MTNRMYPLPDPLYPAPSSAESQSAPGRATLLQTIGTLVALVLLVYLLSQQGWKEIGVTLHQIPLWRLALAMGLMIISRLAVWMRWHVLLNGALYRDGALYRNSSAATVSCTVAVSPGQSFRLTFAGLFANNFLFSTIGGDVVRLAGALQLKLDGSMTAASLIVDRLVGMAGMAMTVPFGITRFLEARPVQSDSFGPSPDWAASLLFSRLGNWGEMAWVKVRKFLNQLLEALSLWLKHPRSLLQALAFTWVHMICTFAFLYLIFQGMEEYISFWSIGGIYSLVYFVTLLPISINGYGLQELSMTFVFSSLGGVSTASSIAAALIFRTWTMLASLPGAAFVPLIMAGRNVTNRGGRRPPEE